MGKFVDITGQKFGRLAAISHFRKEGRIKWYCICDCGGSTITGLQNLKSGKTQSCGCLQRERTSQANFKDLTGKRFGKLTVISIHGKAGEKNTYLCQCDCGNKIVVLGNNLVSGATNSCGCIRRETTRKLKLSHGKHGTRLYTCWKNMLNRCNDPKNKEYKNYGARGISVCEEWRDFNSFFKWATSNGYSDSLTIDRINVNKGYSPDNCRWADLHTQARNKTNNRVFSLNGETMVLEDWSKRLGVDSSTIRCRLKQGWSIEDALTKPPCPNRKSVIQYQKDGSFVKQYDSIKQAARENGISDTAISPCLRGKRKYAGGFVWKYAK